MGACTQRAFPPLSPEKAGVRGLGVTYEVKTPGTSGGVVGGDLSLSEATEGLGILLFHIGWQPWTTVLPGQRATLEGQLSPPGLGYILGPSFFFF